MISDMISTDRQQSAVFGRRRIVRASLFVILIAFSCSPTAHGQTQRSEDDPRNLAPTVGTGGPPGGPTGLFTIYDGQTIRKGEYTFSAAYSNYDRDPGNVDITEIPLSFQVGVNDYSELFFTTDAYRGALFGAPPANQAETDSGGSSVVSVPVIGNSPRTTAEKAQDGMPDGANEVEKAALVALGAAKQLTKDKANEIAKEIDKNTKNDPRINAKVAEGWKNIEDKFAEDNKKSFSGWYSTGSALDVLPVPGLKKAIERDLRDGLPTAYEKAWQWLLYNQPSGSYSAGYTPSVADEFGDAYDQWLGKTKTRIQTGLEQRADWAKREANEFIQFIQPGGYDPPELTVQQVFGLEENQQSGLFPPESKAESESRGGAGVPMYLDPRDISLPGVIAVHPDGSFLWNIPGTAVVIVHPPLPVPTVALPTTTGPGTSVVKDSSSDPTHPNRGGTHGSLSPWDVVGFQISTVGVYPSRERASDQTDQQDFSKPRIVNQLGGTPGSSHDSQPYLTLDFIISLQGVFPSRDSENGGGKDTNEVRDLSDNPKVSETVSINPPQTDGGRQPVPSGVVGVLFPGSTGFAHEENSALNSNFDPTKADRALAAEFISLAAVGDSSSARLLGGPLGGVIDGLDRFPDDPLNGKENLHVGGSPVSATPGLPLATDYTVSLTNFPPVSTVESIVGKPLLEAESFTFVAQPFPVFIEPTRPIVHGVPLTLGAPATTNQADRFVRTDIFEDHMYPSTLTPSDVDLKKTLEFDMVMKGLDKQFITSGGIDLSEEMTSGLFPGAKDKDEEKNKSNTGRTYVPNYILNQDGKIVEIKDDQGRTVWARDVKTGATITVNYGKPEGRTNGSDPFSGLGGENGTFNISEPVRQSEYTIGSEPQLNSNFLLSARYTHEQMDGAIEDDGIFNDAGSEAYFIGNPGEAANVPVDPIQETRVVTNSFAPEFGQNTGGSISVITKGGTNDLKDSIFYFFRDDSPFEADALGGSGTNFEDTRGTEPLPGPFEYLSDTSWGDHTLKFGVVQGEMEREDKFVGLLNWIEYNGDTPLDLKKVGLDWRVILSSVGLAKWNVCQASTDPLLTSADSSEPTHSQWVLEKVGLTRKLHERIIAEEDKSRRPIIVAVIDSGIDLSHPELWGQLWRNKREIPFNRIDDDRNGYVDDVYGYNTQADNSNIWDENGHGTAVAGIIAARRNGRGTDGVAPDCRLMVVKAFNAAAQSDSARVALAIQYAVLNGANIIHISAENNQPHEIDQDMIDWASGKGVLVIAASGSRGRNTKGVSPANLRGVLTVGATDQNDKWLKFSGWGKHVDLVAPGINVLSLRAHGTDFMPVLSGNVLDIKQGERIVEDLWYRADGTSFSAPLVTGVAAAIWSRNPELTAQQIKNKILMSCDDVERTGWDIVSGAGRLNAAKALNADPNHYLSTRIFDTEIVTKDRGKSLAVMGEATGTHFKARTLQMAFGENPKDENWQTIQTNIEQVQDGVLGQIPGSKLNRRGIWSIRSSVTDHKGETRDSLTTIRIE